jgi:hypothetical protein
MRRWKKNNPEGGPATLNFTILRLISQTLVLVISSHVDYNPPNAVLPIKYNETMKKKLSY